MVIQRLAVVMLFCFITTFALAQKVNQIYVSNAGADSNSGSIDSPVKTLSKAIAIAKQYNGNTSIYVRGGYYSLINSVEISNIKNVSISAYKKEKVIISGGKKIDPRFINSLKDSNILDRLTSVARSNVYQIDLKEADITNYGNIVKHGYTWISPSQLELFIDDKPFILSRWPNNDYVDLGEVLDTGSIPRNGQNDNRGATIRFGFDQPLKWKNSQSVWVHGVFANGYSDDNLKIKEIDNSSKTITFLQPSIYGVQGDNKDKINYRRYFFYNILEELDSAGEYFIDSTNNMIYFCANNDIKNLDINVSILDKPLIVLKNSENISIEGIIFGYSRGMGIYLQSNKNVRIHKCDFKNLGTVGISLNNPLSKSNTDYRNTLISDSNESNLNVEINSCNIVNTGTGGIILSGGDRKNLIEANNVISNCNLDNFSRLNMFGCPAVTIDGVGNKVLNCDITNSTGQAITYLGNNHEIAFNNIKHVVSEVSDQGAVYTGRDPSSAGTKIHDNFFDDIKSKYGSAAALYIDDGSGGIYVYNNIFSDCGSVGEYPFGAIHINGGGNNSFDNNYFVNCDRAFSMSSWSNEKWKQVMFNDVMKKKLTSDVNITSKVYLDQYPFLNNFFNTSNISPRINKISNTIAYKVKDFASNKVGLKQSNTVITDSDPGFKDLSNKNFNLIIKKNTNVKRFQNSQSVTSDKGNLDNIRPIDFNKIGFRKLKNE